MAVELCPVCGIELKTRIVYEIEADYCPRCGGIWLDGGELNKLLEKVRSYRGDDDYEEECSDHGCGGKRKKRSLADFFEDIFDFG